MCQANFEIRKRSFDGNVFDFNYIVKYVDWFASMNIMRTSFIQYNYVTNLVDLTCQPITNGEFDTCVHHVCMYIYIYIYIIYIYILYIIYIYIYI